VPLTNVKDNVFSIIAKSFAAEVERRRGAKSDSRSDAEVQLVDAKLEMVCADWLFQPAGIVRRLCLLSRVDRLQRDEIH
jgi:hypothetical protein